MVLPVEQFQFTSLWMTKMQKHAIYTQFTPTALSLSIWDIFRDPQGYARWIMITGIRQCDKVEKRNSQPFPWGPTAQYIFPCPSTSDSSPNCLTFRWESVLNKGNHKTWFKKKINKINQSVLCTESPLAVQYVNNGDDSLFIPQIVK